MSSTMSRPRVALGAIVALIVPVAFLFVAKLIEAGAIQVVRDGSTMTTLTSIALTETFLGPIGIAIGGRAAGLRRPVGWLALIVVGLPVLAVVWFVGAASLSGALGSPF